MAKNSFVLYPISKKDKKLKQVLINNEAKERMKKIKAEYNDIKQSALEMAIKMKEINK